MFCPKCGAQLKDNARFCRLCGQQLFAEAPPPKAPEPQPQQTNLQQTAAVRDVTPQQNTQPGYAQPPQYNGPQAKRSKAVPITVITLSVMLLLTAAFLLFIKPGFLISKDEGSSSDADPSSSLSSFDGSEADSDSISESSESSGGDSSESDETSSEDESREESSAAETTAVPESSEETVTTASQTTTVSATQSTTGTTTRSTTKAAAQTTTKSTTKATTKSTTKSTTKPAPSEKNSVLEEAAKYSTYDRPSSDEFGWCFGQFGLVSGPPEGTKTVTDPLAFSGGWKAMIIYNPNDTSAGFTREFDNIDIKINNGKVSLTIDWYYLEEPESETMNLEDMDDVVFTGKAGSKGISVTGIADITVNSLWKANGKEYAVGKVTTTGGTQGYLALVRK